MENVPHNRIRRVNEAPVRGRGDFVLYWMIAARRVTSNFGLQRAVEWTLTLKKPLMVLEALRCDYQYASVRLHRFIIDGMADNCTRTKGTNAVYYPYIEREKGEGKGLLEFLGSRACVVVTDEFPCFFLPRMVETAARRIGVCLEAVDSNGILPLGAAEKVFATAFSFRRFLQQHLRDHLDAFPDPDPLGKASFPRLSTLPRKLTEMWPRAEIEPFLSGSDDLDRLPIDRSVYATSLRGGSIAAEHALEAFIRTNLARYHTERNHPDEDATSRLSAYLHFGHISPHEIFERVADKEEWSKERLASTASGKRGGWWGMSEGAEAFLDQLVTWRELGYNLCHMRKDYDQYDSLPTWARATLGVHRKDPRPYLYTIEEFERAGTHDALWNAVQRQLLVEGRIHGYLRMLWGKKILEWSSSPEEALAVMIELNDKYALDGRDPNSSSGIFWILGRYDRPWGPERKIFGKVRYMSSANTCRKVRVAEYLRRFGSV